MEANLSNHKLVYSAEEYSKLCKLPYDWYEVLKDGDYSAIITGVSGSGKDSITGALICNDLAHGRTPVILDRKMEYPFAIIGQGDPALVNILNQAGLSGRGYHVNLWVPYVDGMNENAHFQELLTLNHPNLKVRPFRILKNMLVSEDTANLSLQKSAMQSMKSQMGKAELKGPLASMDEFKEEMGRIKLGFDDQDESYEGCGWEYINFEELSRNKQINVITTYFMARQSRIATVSFMIGIMNELLTIGQGAHSIRLPEDVFSITIPEMQIIMPKGVRALDNVVNTLQFAILEGLLLMRSFGIRLRMNLQNLSALMDDMLSQSKLFAGRTMNQKDLRRFTVFNIGKELKVKMMYLPTGQFVDIMKKRQFSVVPYFHKARAGEGLVLMLREFKSNPGKFLFETEHGLLSPIIDHSQMDLKFPCTVQEYNRKVRAWIKNQKPQTIQPITQSIDKNLDNISEEFGKLAGAF